MRTFTALALDPAADMPFVFVVAGESHYHAECVAELSVDEDHNVLHVREGQWTAAEMQEDLDRTVAAAMQ